MGVPSPSFDPTETDQEAEPFGMAQGFRPDLDAYEGPLDVMLDLARRHKIDLAEVSIGTLVDQFLAWLEQVVAQNKGLERGAAALIAVAWLVDLKVRSLFPGPKVAQFDPADALRRQLMHLEMIRSLASRLTDRHRLGRDVFERGYSDEPRIYRDYRRSAHGLTKYYHVSPLMKDGQVTWVSKAGKSLQTPSPAVELATLFEVAKAFGPRKVPEVQANRGEALVFRPAETVPVEVAMKSFRAMALQRPEGFGFEEAVPESPAGLRRSAYASSLIAILELAKDGELEVEQLELFGQMQLMRPKIPRET
jgi:chromatin segregation and condensation protein Rec8/ScpA/Scc1 (kleisin family)